MARAAPDGYTIMLGTSSTYAIATNVYKKVPLRPDQGFRADRAGGGGAVRADRASGAAGETVMDLVRLAKSKPGALNYASAGIGAQHHVSAELLKT